MACNHKVAITMQTLKEITINKYVKKLKAYEREALLPLYYEHAEYLLSVIKTVDIADQILAKIDTYIEVATCHEIAINSLSSLDLETHQNRLGKEREYTNHAMAKNVGRDLRVRLIWEIIKTELESDITLAKYSIYKNLSDIPDGRVFCPICGQLIREYEYYQVVDGEHDDGTIDYHYSIINNYDSPCEHMLISDSEFNVDYYDDEMKYYVKRLHDQGVYLSDIQQWGFQNSHFNLISEYEGHVHRDGDEILNYFVQESFEFVLALKWLYAEKCIENEIEFEEY